MRIKSEELRLLYGDNLVIVDDVFTAQSIQRVCAAYAPKLVVIDQLAEFIWHDPNESRVIWYGKVVKHLRHYVANNLDCPVILNHHINRAVEVREDKRPQLSDLRDSGEVENRSDVVLLCYREDIYSGRDANQYEVPMEVRVAKNRQGETGGVAVLNFNLKEQWFS